MVNLSKYEKEKKIKKYHNRGITRKASENLIRAFAGIAPPIRVIVDMVFSLVNAERSQAIYDFMNWAQGRLEQHGLDIYKLGDTQDEIQENFKKVTKSLNLKIEDLQIEIIELYRDAEYFSKEERQKIIELLSENNLILKSVDKKTDNISEGVSTIIRLLDKKDSSDMISEELASKLLDEIEKKIDLGELNKSLDQIFSILNHSQFENISDKLKVEFLSIYGKILFDLVKKDDLAKTIDKLLNFEKITKRKCDIILSYSVAEKRKNLFDIAIAGYRLLKYEEPKIEVLSQYFNIALEKPDKVIRALCYKSKSGQYHIKQKYKNYKKAYEYVGIAFFTKDDFSNARSFFIRADETKKTLLIKYRILFCDAGIILSRVGSIKTLTKLERQILLDTYNELADEDIKKYFSERPPKISMDYWRVRLMIKMYLNRENALKEYNIIPDDIKKHREIQIKKGDILLSINKLEEAQSIYNKLYEKSKKSELLSRIFDCLIMEEKYVEILELAKTIDNESYYENVFICKTIVAANFFTEGFEKGNQLADEYLSKVDNPTILLFEIGHLNAISGNIDIAKDYFEKCSSSIPKDDYPLRTEIARECSDHGFDDLAINILKPFIKYNENGKKQYIDIILRSRKEKLYQEAEKIINEELEKSTNRKAWLKRKVDLEYFRGNKNTAFKIGEELFELTKSPDVAYNLMILKNELGLSDYGKYSEVLSIQKNPMYVMAAAICYKLDGNFQRASDFAYMALALDQSEFNEILFVQYAQLHLYNFPKKELPKIEWVGANTSVHLKDGKNFWITIDSDRTLFTNLKPFKFAGSIHYLEEHDSILGLIDKQIGEKVKLNGKEYEIVEIIPNYVAAFRYCLETYTKNVPNSDVIYSISVDLKNPFQSIIPVLEAKKKSDADIINRYNNIKELGMPLWIMAQKKSRNIADVMIYLIDKNDQIYYTGEVRRFDFKNEKIVLSPISIILLGLLNKTDILSSSAYKFFITKSTKDYLKDSLLKSRKDKNIKATMGIGDDSNISFKEMTEDAWKKRTEFFTNIYDKLKNINTEKIDIKPEELDKYKSIIELIRKPDYESILLSKEVKGIYITDDLFIRKIFRMIHQNNMHSNSISFLFEHYSDNIGEFIDIQKALSEWDYHYLYNAEIVIDTIKALNHQHRLIGPGTAYDSFEKIIHNSMRTEIGFSSNETELLSAIFALYDFRADSNYEECFKIILKKIVMYYSFYASDITILKAKIKFLLGKYPLRKRYFLRLIDDIIKKYTVY